MDEDWRMVQVAGNDPQTRRRRTKDKDPEPKPSVDDIEDTKGEDDTARHYFLRLDYWPV